MVLLFSSPTAIHRALCITYRVLCNAPMALPGRWCLQWSLEHGTCARRTLYITASPWRSLRICGHERPLIGHGRAASSGGLVHCGCASRTTSAVAALLGSAQYADREGIAEAGSGAGGRERAPHPYRSPAHRCYGASSLPAFMGCVSAALSSVSWQEGARGHRGAPCINLVWCVLPELALVLFCFVL